MSIVDDVQREQDIYELAVDIARQIFPLPSLLLKYKVTEKELEELYNNIVFRELIKQATAEWNAAGNTHKRVKLKAAVLTEQVLGTLYDSMTSKYESLSERVKALDTVAKIAGLQSNDGAGGPIGSTFRLSINFAPSSVSAENITLEVNTPESIETPPNEEQEETQIEEAPPAPVPLQALELLPLASRFAGLPPEAI